MPSNPDSGLPCEGSAKSQLPYEWLEELEAACRLANLTAPADTTLWVLPAAWIGLAAALLVTAFWF